MLKRPEYRAEIVGQNLKRLRQENGFSVEEIRDYLCLGSVQAVYKYENGRGYPPADAMLALMELYGADVEELVTYHKPHRDNFAVRSFCCNGEKDMELVFFPRDIGGQLFRQRMWRFAGTYPWDAGGTAAREV